ncbi:MAG: MerR family transcriptional regulator, partial [Spirochaetae bacterium HGW-Spirochaetae-8]
MDENLIGLRIKKHRLIEGITLKELASRCNVTSSLLSQIEKGKASPSLSTLRKIAVELQTT